MRRLVNAQYTRNDIDLTRGSYRLKGDTLDIYLSYAEDILRIIFWDDEIDSIETLDPINNVTIQQFEDYKIYPANIFVTTQERVNSAIDQIALDLGEEVQE